MLGSETPCIFIRFYLFFVTSVLAIAGCLSVFCLFCCCALLSGVRVYCRVYFSLPVVRFDNKKANTILHNLIVKLKKVDFDILENHNIKEGHLGRKGLHLNDHGVKIMASNIKSLIKHL